MNPLTVWYNKYDRKNKIWYDDLSFKKFMYEHICQCFEQCIDLQIPFLKLVKNKQICTEINKNFDITNLTLYDNLIENVLFYFINKNILIKIGVKYYIISGTDKLKLTWENIKTITDKNIKELLWLFRKIIIDTILRKILFSIQDKDFKMYSVGSSNINSDYDITLYGKTSDKSLVINRFQQEFKKYFYDDSAIVFDTNIYGEAYITFNPEVGYEKFYTKVTCEMDFFYLNESSNDSQLMWGLVKYLSNIRDSFGESIYNDLTYFMEKKLKYNHVYNAKKTLIYLRNKDKDSITYEKLFNIKESFIESYDDTLSGISDYISLINYYGSETYYTRGAFLDTVVNNQMCKSDIVKLNECDYIVSILENAGFFFIHNNKTKYIIRVYKTLLKLINNYSDNYNIIKTQHSFKTLTSIIEDLGENPDEKYCKWILNDSFDLLKCEKFNIFNQLFNIIYKLLSIYTSNNKSYDENFTFYNNYVIKNTLQLGSPNIPSPSNERISLTEMIK